MRSRFFELEGQTFVIASANGFGGGGPREQAELTVNRLRQDLEKVGSRFENILRIAVYMKSREIWGAVSEVRQQAFIPWETRPASASIFVGEFRPDGALVEIEATAMVRPDIVPKRGIEFDPPRPYLKALVSERFAFVSGAGGEGQNEQAQAESSLTRLEAHLKEVGGSIHDLSRVTIFLKRREALGEVSRVFQRLFVEPRPYLEFIPATGFAREEMLLEIQAMAVLPRPPTG